MRKSIFDIVKSNTDPASDALRLDSMFREEKTLEIYDEQYTLEKYIDNYRFGMWKQRGHCLNVEDFLETLGYDTLRRSAAANTESLFTLIEVIYNFWYLADCDLNKPSNAMSMSWYGNFVHLKDVMDDVLKQYNQTAYFQEDSECVLVVEDKPEVTAAAEIVPESLALSVIRYNHRLLHGNLNAKKSILLEFGRELEPRRKELETLNKTLAANIFFMLNNMNIRHNNQNINDPSKYRKCIADMDEHQLEEWYDELYQMTLLAFLLLDNVKRQESIEELKKKVMEK